METMKFIQISDYMTKVIFEEILKESEKMSLQIIETSFIVLKMMGKSIENNQKMISHSYLTKGSQNGCYEDFLKIVIRLTNSLKMNVNDV